MGTDVADVRGLALFWREKQGVGKTRFRIPGVRKLENSILLLFYYEVILL